ncbi:MAG: ATP-dependent helicase [Clostridiaceae bacterium]
MDSVIRFREDQQEIMKYNNGTMAVPAVPGAGKTFVIANLATKLIKENGKRGNKILIVTYMNSAVNNFKSRIAQFLIDSGVKGNSKYEVMTIHSLAMKILKEKPSAVAVGEEFRIIDEFNGDDILFNIINKWVSSGGQRYLRWFLQKDNDDNLDRWTSGFFSVIRTLIGELKVNGIEPDKLKDQLDMLKDNSILRLIAPIYIRYCNELRMKGYLDYNDLLVLSLKALQEDESLRNKIQRRYKYIFEDECQDSNLIQGKLLTILSEGHKNLIRVGDVNQSITGTFSSSDPKFFKEFCINADVSHSMFISSRSSVDIINLANDFVDYVNNSLEEVKCRDALTNQLIKPVKEGFGKMNPVTEKYQITTVNFATNNEEREKIIASVEGFIAKQPNKTIGILVPSNDEIKKYAKLLSEKNIQYEELSRMPGEPVKVIEDIALILAYLSNPTDKDTLIRTIKEIFFKEEDFNIIDEVLNTYTLEELMYKENYEIEEMLLSDNHEKQLYGSYLKAINFINSILKLKLFPIEELIVDIGEKLYSSKEDLAMVQGVATYVKQVMVEERLLLKDVSTLIKEKNFIFGRLAETIYESEGFEPRAGVVTICTYHKSKGLEFDRVHLTALTNYNFPTTVSGNFNGEYYYLKDEYKNPIALGKSEIAAFLGEELDLDPFIEAKREYIRERARLLYVGITRAREYLIISTHRKKVDFKREEKPSGYFDFLRERTGGR